MLNRKRKVTKKARENMRKAQLANPVRYWLGKKRPDFDINNGITLREEVHIEFHKIYGFRNNTKEQMDIFLKNQNG